MVVMRRYGPGGACMCCCCSCIEKCTCRVFCALLQYPTFPCHACVQNSLRIDRVQQGVYPHISFRRRCASGVCPYQSSPTITSYNVQLRLRTDTAGAFPGRAQRLGSRKSQRAETLHGILGNNENRARWCLSH
ncbi:unnamed protein product, partial [Ectocarpus sp. 13 AM-2016]